MVADSRSSCTERSVAEVGARPTDEKRTSVSRAQSYWTGVGDEASVVSQVAGSVSRQRLVDDRGNVELDVLLTHWKPVQLAENWCIVPTGLICNFMRIAFCE